MTTDTITLNFEPNALPTKKEIIERLFKQELITFDEMWVLLIGEDEYVKYVPLPYNPYPWTYCTTSTQ